MKIKEIKDAWALAMKDISGRYNIDEEVAASILVVFVASFLEQGENAPIKNRVEDNAANFFKLATRIKNDRNSEIVNRLLFISATSDICKAVNCTPSEAVCACGVFYFSCVLWVNNFPAISGQNAEIFRKIIKNIVG